jgi:leucyl aminopeptidase
MRIIFSQKGLVDAPKQYVRIRLTEESKGVRRHVREGGTTWLEIGTGPRKEVNQRKFIVICRSIIREAKKQKFRKVALQMNLSPFPQMNALTLPELGKLIAENFVMADFDFTDFKTAPKDGWDTVSELLICGETPKDMQAGFTRGQEIGKAVNACRTLANTPGGDMTPTALAKEAKDAMKGLPVKVTTLGEKEMQKLGMGALLGVAKGSSEKPTFTILEYKGGTGKPIVLAGKGVTFDSGGLNLKPSTGIYEMHMDMSGAASVVHTVALAARLKLKKHVIGLIPSVENMPGNNAYRPGDILKSLSGKTIEVLNTDAEGRLILADAITYAKRFDPAVVIDVATLTGAAMSALGLHASALFTRDDALAKTVEALAEESGDYVWRLPLWDEYEDNVQGTFADVTNSSNAPGGKYGGAIEGGMFLWQFAKELSCPWVHLDIAPRMTSAPGEELAKGAAGAPVRLLLRFIEQWTA